jgi:hypothetical protein
MVRHEYCATVDEMKTRIRKSLAIVACIAIVGYAKAVSADPIFLGSAVDSFGTGSGSPVTALRFQLYYGNDSINPPACLGCNILFAPGYEETVRLDAASEGAQFTDFMQLLTNGIDYDVSANAMMFDNSTFAGGGGGGALESTFFPGADLTTWDVSSVDMTIVSETIYQNNSIGFGAEYTVRWDFWGEGSPVTQPDPLPEPTTLLMFAIGGFACVSKRYLGRESRIDGN